MPAQPLRGCKYNAMARDMGRQTELRSESNVWGETPSNVRIGNTNVQWICVPARQSLAASNRPASEIEQGVRSSIVITNGGAINVKKHFRLLQGIACISVCAGLACGHAVAQAGADAPPGASHGTAPPPNVVAGTITANVTVSDAMLHNAAKDNNNWLLHGRTYDNQRFSPLTQISAANVKKLAPVAIVQVLN